MAGRQGIVASVTKKYFWKGSCSSQLLIAEVELSKSFGNIMSFRVASWKEAIGDALCNWGEMRDLLLKYLSLIHI